MPKGGSPDLSVPIGATGKVCLMQSKKPKFLSDRELNIIRGKVIVGGATLAEVLKVFGHIDKLEAKLDDTDEEGDFYGTEGWRHFLGLPDSD